MNTITILKLIIGCILILSPFVLIIVFAIRYQKKMFHRAWDNVVDIFTQKGFLLRSAIPIEKSQMLKISGEKNGHNIHVFSEYVRSGKNRVLITKCEFLGIDNPVDFTIYKENIFTRMGEALGMNDVKTGDDEFDKHFRLKSSKVDVTTVLTDKMRSELIARKKDLTGTITLKNNKLTVFTNASPGNKYGLRSFKNNFDIGLLFIEKKQKGVAGHSPYSV